MKKILIGIILLISCSSAQDMMRIKMKDGSLQTFPIDMIAKITFSVPTPVDEQMAKTMTNVIKTFSLLQNYPNPFNPTTTIIYALPRSNNVTVRIYDITGRLIKTLLDEYQQLGEHRLQWDSRNTNGQLVASGMYLYEIRYEGALHIRKMLMLK